MDPDLRLEAANALDAALRLPQAEALVAIALGDAIGAALAGSPTIRAIEARISGSVAKCTAIRPLRDLDVIVVLDPKNPRVDPTRIGPAELIRRVSQAIGAAQRAQIRDGLREVFPQDHSAALLTPEGEPDIDFIPAFVKPGGYLRIAERSTGRYVLTSVDRQREALKRLSGRAPGLLLAIRLLKAWRRAAPRRVHLGSYALELLAMHAVTQGKVGGVEILEHTLGLLATPDLRFAVDGAHGLQAGARRCYIADLAVPTNNVAARLTVAQRTRTAGHAAETLARWSAAGTAEAAARALGVKRTREVNG